MKKDELDKLVTDTINSMDGARRAEPAPYLLTRINARLQQPVYSAWDRISIFLSKPGIALAAATFLIILNLLIFSSASSTTSVKMPQGTAAGQDVYSYNTPSSLYDLENITP